MAVSPRTWAWAVTVALCYVIVLGGTTEGDLSAGLRTINAVVAGALIIVYLLRVPTRADRVDRWIVVALVLFAIAAVFSRFPRQSFDVILSCLGYAAGLYVARGILSVKGHRDVLIRAFMGLSLVLTVLTAARWLPIALEWWALTDWTVIPPLDMDLDAWPWGHRHDMALLVTMLYPAWWIGRMSVLRTSAAMVIGLLVLIIVVLDGSRTLWLALIVSSAVLAFPALRLRLLSERRVVWATAAAAGVLLAIALVSGAATTLLDRVLTLNTLSARSEMWGALLKAWIAEPLAGYGPGSFPWVLQLTSYFDTNSWAPRHPDSLLFQLLPEAGLLGLVAAVAVAAAVLPPLIRARSSAARWALAAFLIVGIGANPTDFAFLIVVAIAWVAYAIPRDDSLPAAHHASHRLRAVMAGCGVVIALAYTLTLGASYAYETARVDIAAGDIEAGGDQLDLAVALDPGLALYARQRGTVSLLEGEGERALPSLELATELNPSDDLAWRTLALARAQQGDIAEALRVLGQALDRQSSDATNLLLAAAWQAEDSPDATRASLEQAVLWSPYVVGAPGWNDLLPRGLTTAAVIDGAVERWLGTVTPDESFGTRGLTLFVEGDRDDLEARAINQSGLSPRLADAFVAVAACDPGASTLLDLTSDGDRRRAIYWALRIRDAARLEAPDGVARRLYLLMNRDALPVSTATSTINPLHENDGNGFSADEWGYRRRPIAWTDAPLSLPSPRAGWVRFITDPEAATQAAGLHERLPNCR